MITYAQRQQERAARRQEQQSLKAEIRAGHVRFNFCRKIGHEIVEVIDRDLPLAEANRRLIERNRLLPKGCGITYVLVPSPF